MNTRHTQRNTTLETKLQPKPKAKPIVQPLPKPDDPVPIKVDFSNPIYESAQSLVVVP